MYNNPLEREVSIYLRLKPESRKKKRERPPNKKKKKRKTTSQCANKSKFLAPDVSDGLARSALASDDTLWAWKRGGRGGKRGGRQRRQVAAAHWLPLSNAGVKTTTHEVTYFLSPSNKLYIQHFGPALANRLAPFSLSKGASCNSELQRQNAERLFRAISWLGIEILTSRRRDLFAEEKQKKREEKKIKYWQRWSKLI